MRIFTLCLLSLAVITLSALGIRSLRQSSSSICRTTRLETDAEAISVAMRAYEKDMKAYPPGDIEEALLGNNPKHVAYFAEPPEDPWGTPYGIYRSSKNIVIRSAGPDRTFATGSTARSDDLFYSYSAKAAR